jgi:hypothetical protein
MEARMDLGTRYRVCTWIAGTASLGMGAFHLVLPQVFGWGPYVARLPPAVHWGMYAINCFFSILLILGALLSLRTRIDSGDAARLVPLGMGVFWTINAAYQLIIPFPMPRSMQPLRWALLAFPILVAACYGVAWFAASSSTRRPDIMRPG